MPIISFPIEAFDEESMKIDKIRPQVSFSFRQDLQELCRVLEIPSVIKLTIDEKMLNTYASKLASDAHERFMKIREELAFKYFNSPMTPGFDIMSVASVEDKSTLMNALKDDMYTSSTFGLRHVLDCYDIKVPDELLDEYLMVKMSI